MGTQEPFSFPFLLIGMFQIFRPCLRVPRSTEQRIMNTEYNFHSQKPVCLTQSNETARNAGLHFGIPRAYGQGHQEETLEPHDGARPAAHNLHGKANSDTRDAQPFSLASEMSHGNSLKESSPHPPVLSIL